MHPLFIQLSIFEMNPSHTASKVGNARWRPSGNNTVAVTTSNGGFTSNSAMIAIK
jgi:hypothetical protein